MPFSFKRESSASLRVDPLLKEPFVESPLSPNLIATDIVSVKAFASGFLGFDSLAIRVGGSLLTEAVFTFWLVTILGFEVSPSVLVFFETTGAGSNFGTFSLFLL